MQERDTDVLSLTYGVIEQALHSLTINECLKLHQIFSKAIHPKPYHARMIQAIVKELAQRQRYIHILYFAAFCGACESWLDASDYAHLLQQMNYRVYYDGEYWHLVDPLKQVIASQNMRTIKFNGIGEL